MAAQVQSVFSDRETGLFGSFPLRGNNMNDNDSPLYTTDEFRMYCFKVLPCSKRYCHDWTTCPLAHPGEKAKRRDPRLFCYIGTACPEMKKNLQCHRGESCPYAHNVFEYWLHPSRYRTQLCNDGSNCKRKVCFFAHSLEELRMPASKPTNPYSLEGCGGESLLDTTAGTFEDPFNYGCGQYLSSPASVLSRDSWDSGSGSASSNSNLSAPTNNWTTTYVQKPVNPAPVSVSPTGGVSTALQATVAAASAAANVNVLASKIAELNLNSSEQQSLIDLLKSVMHEVGKGRPIDPAVGHNASSPRQQQPTNPDSSFMRPQSNSGAHVGQVGCDYAQLPSLSAGSSAPFCSAPMMMSLPGLHSSKSLPFPVRHAQEESMTNNNIAQLAAPYRTLSATEQLYQREPFLRNLEAFSSMYQTGGQQLPQQSSSDSMMASRGAYTVSMASNDAAAATDQLPMRYSAPTAVSAEMLVKRLHSQLL